MAQRKPYNPNTKYGRQKYREEAMKRIANYTGDEKTEFKKIQNNIWIVAIIMLFIAGIIIYLVSGPEALMKWLRK